MGNEDSLVTTYGFWCETSLFTSMEGQTGTKILHWAEHTAYIGEFGIYVVELPLASHDHRRQDVDRAYNGPPPVFPMAVLS